MTARALPPDTAILGTSILVWSASLERPELLGTLFLTAQACAAMELQTELIFTAQSVSMLQKTQQNRQVGYGAVQKTLGDYLMDCHSAGITLWACSQALHHLGLARKDLVPECAGLGGVVQYAARCADPAWRTLIF